MSPGKPDVAETQRPRLPCSRLDCPPLTLILNFSGYVLPGISLPSLFLCRGSCSFLFMKINSDVTQTLRNDFSSSIHKLPQTFHLNPSAGVETLHFADPSFCYGHLQLDGEPGLAGHSVSFHALQPHHMSPAPVTMPSTVFQASGVVTHVNMIGGLLGCVIFSVSLLENVIVSLLS